MIMPIVFDLCSRFFLFSESYNVKRISYNCHCSIFVYYLHYIEMKLIVEHTMWTDTNKVTV